MKRYIWQPLAFFAVGLGFYIYNGVTWHTWDAYLPHVVGYAIICSGLSWALYTKEKLKNK